MNISATSALDILLGLLLLAILVVLDLWFRRRAPQASIEQVTLSGTWHWVPDPPPGPMSPGPADPVPPKELYIASLKVIPDSGYGVEKKLEVRTGSGDRPSRSQLLKLTPAVVPFQPKQTIVLNKPVKLPTFEQEQICWIYVSIGGDGPGTESSGWHEWLTYEWQVPAYVRADAASHPTTINLLKIHW